MSALAFIAHEVNRSNSCDKNTIMLYGDIEYITKVVWQVSIIWVYMLKYNNV